MNDLWNAPWWMWLLAVVLTAPFVVVALGVRRKVLHEHDGLTKLMEASKAETELLLDEMCIQAQQHMEEELLLQADELVARHQRFMDSEPRAGGLVHLSSRSAYVISQLVGMVQYLREQRDALRFDAVRLHQQRDEAVRDYEYTQARLDAVMLEHCPEDMTAEQVERWGAHQRAVTPEEEENIRELTRRHNDTKPANMVFATGSAAPLVADAGERRYMVEPSKPWPHSDDGVADRG